MFFFLYRMHVRTGWAKIALFFSVDNLATVNGGKASDTSKFSEFCLEISVKLAYRCV